MLNGKELQVGKSYKSTEGDWYVIRKSDNLEYPFIGSDEEKDEEWHYTSKGLFMIGEQHEPTNIIDCRSSGRNRPWANENLRNFKTPEEITEIMTTAKTLNLSEKTDS